MTESTTMAEIGGNPVNGRPEAEAKERVGRLYERYAAHVLAYAMRRTDHSDAADVVAETFLVAWRRRDAVPDEPTTLPWLYGVARRVLANQHRSRRRRSRLRDRLGEQLAGQRTQSVDWTDVGNLADITKALARLGDDDAELLRLAGWEDLSPSEIAIVMDIAPGTARQRVRRARIRLREQLANDGIVQPDGRDGGSSGASRGTGPSPVTDRITGVGAWRHDR